ncbi:hypothetical protein CTA1_9369 [Colletotrichum tanaceti]|uniref:DUF7136 domain-containing protein n=1 Tax=Colletotrichum tanaceti TaxID=1306861 RepID=A0A4U6X8T9_9PEZI|nr:hypothetical protein CTA1_9369 [Colletotrichum tanaceti]
MRIRPEMSRPVCFPLTLMRLAGLILALSLPSAATAATAATAAAVVGVDLVFPRNDTLYRPVWPFPIVFAVRNASQLWPSDGEEEEGEEEKPFSFWVRWDLTGYTDINDPDTGQLFSSGVWQTDRLNRTTTEAAAGAAARDVAVIDASRRDLVGAPQRQFRLKYTATLFGSCPVNATAEGAGSRPRDLSHDGHVVFTTTDPSATAAAEELPAVVADETTCPVPIGRFGITGSRHQRGALCPVASSSSGSPSSSSSSTACRLEMNGSLADEVERTMLDRAGCPRGTWPDPDGGLSPTSCNAASSSSSAKGLGARAAGVSALVLTLAASWAFI